MKELEDGLIPPVGRDLLKAELTRERFLRNTNNASNEIYVVNAHNSPNVMREIGRLRELSFRTAGGGTGKALDIDHYDTDVNPYEQLLVWDPAAEEILGGYRYIICKNAPVDSLGVPKLATSGMFRFSEKFLSEYMPYTIELGRSFVQPAYQPARENRKSIYSLDNLWDGLGTLMVDHPDVRYFFGKVTMYTHFNIYARDLILYFLGRFFPDPDKLVYPLKPINLKTPVEKLEKVFTADTLEENYKLLSKEVRKLKENIPPLISAYSGLSSTMKTFGTAINEEFGGVEETGILITIADIHEGKIERYVRNYIDSRK
ncbi:MAG: GNAT family N-acetyltransferase [Bacteroidales bacterium]|nr:GNAT family N-acetyltransferase [Bacteroidales bacterium]